MEFFNSNPQPISVTQTLHTVDESKKTGTLTIESYDKSVQLTIKDGILIFAEIKGDDNSLAVILYNAEVITAIQYKAIRARSGNMSDKELGLLLINAGYVTQQDILSSLQEYYFNLIDDLKNCVDATIVFHPETNIPTGKIPVRLN